MKGRLDFNQGRENTFALCISLLGPWGMLISLSEGLTGPLRAQDPRRTPVWTAAPLWLPAGPQFQLTCFRLRNLEGLSNERT